MERVTDVQFTTVGKGPETSVTRHISNFLLITC
jgi:hypothetical protein